MTKAEARTWARRVRGSLSSFEVAGLSEQICRQFVAAELGKTVRCLNVYLPIEAQKEVDSRPILEWFFRNQPSVEVSVPYMLEGDRDFAAVLYREGDGLARGPFGMPQPTEAKAVLHTQIDTVLVPLMAFTRDGYRVGYGGGFYDRFLATCYPGVRKIGLSFFGPIDNVFDVFEGDVRLDWVVTPEEVIRIA